MSKLPRLTRALIASRKETGEAEGSVMGLPDLALLDLPERVVQFGTGALLRGFIESFVDDANRRGAFNGAIVAVSSTGTSRNELLNAQDGLFTLAIEGIEAGKTVQQLRLISSLRRALSAQDEWAAVLRVARDPNIQLVVSNTTEIGIALDDGDTADAAPPPSFPGKLTRWLAERAQAFDYAASAGVVVLPCELIEANGTTLRRLVRDLARRWKLGPDFDAWLSEHVVICNTLVDRIVPGVPPAASAAALEATLGYADAMLTTCEPYALFAIEGDDALCRRLGFAEGNRHVIVAPDIEPYRQRKVRLLNGAHTITVPSALLAGLETVREAVDDPQVGQFLRRALLDEIVPSVDVPEAETFANDVLARFANPYIRHALIDITLHATAKMRVRVVPSILSYAARAGHAPAALACGFAAYLEFMRGDIQAARRSAGQSVPADSEGGRVQAVWEAVAVEGDNAESALVTRVLGDAALWGVDLTTVPGFAALTTSYLSRIRRDGIRAALAHLLANTVST